MASLAPLAERSAVLSNDLTTLSEGCEHDGTRNEISDIAGETLRLSTTLWRLHEAVEANDKDIYTAAFREDLDEITSELKLVFEEICECCTEMQRADTPGPVPWFFKKGRVAKLQKHLVALKTTLAIMRTVLHHGKEYGVHSSPGRLAESSPHILHEDRAILDSILAKNRHAVEDLHDVEESRQHSSSMSSEAQTPAVSDINPGAHRRQLSNATGVDIPDIPDVLPNPTKAAETNSDSTRFNGELQRRFSKRGVRLGVHASILDLGAHETSEGLRKRWLQAARSAEASDKNHQKRMTTISEDGTSVAALEAVTNRGSQELIAATGARRGLGRNSSEESKAGRWRGSSLKLMGSDMGGAMSRLINRLSISHGSSTDAVPSKGGSDNDSSGDGGLNHGSPGNGDAAKNPNSAVGGFAKMSSDRVRQPDITTPEWNQEFENGALGSMQKQYK